MKSFAYSHVKVFEAFLYISKFKVENNASNSEDKEKEKEKEWRQKRLKIPLSLPKAICWLLGWIFHFIII